MTLMKRSPRNIPVKYIEGWYWVHKDWLLKNNLSLAGITRHLTVMPIAFGKKEMPMPMPCYQISDDYLGVPIDWGKHQFGDAPTQAIDTFPTFVAPKIPDPLHPKAPKGQDKFTKEVLSACDRLGMFVAKASTGSGKTVVLLSVAGQLSLRALYIVPTDILSVQWRKHAINHLGLKASDVGLVQQKVCDFKKPITIASLKSLWSTNYPDELYNYHGMIGLDECQVFSAQEMYKVFGKFKAPIQVAVSATPKRKDGRGRVLELWYGTPAVTSTAVPMNAVVIPVIIEHVRASKVRDRTHLIHKLARNSMRNFKILKLIHWLGEVRGRYVLLLSDSTRQLQTIHKGLIGEGVDPAHIGYVVDQLYTGWFKASIRMKPVSSRARIKLTTLMKQLKSDEWFIANGNPQGVNIRVFKDRITLNRFPNLVQGKKQVLQWIRLKGIFAYVDETVWTEVMTKLSPDARENTLENPSVRYLLGTYGSMKYGTDVERIDVLVEGTPRAEGEQQGGRIRRLMEGKPLARIYTIIDRGLSKIIDRINQARKKDYRTLKGVRIKKELKL